jgi:hypothetical protein
MSAWIESHQTLRDHPRKDHLAELLFAGTVQNDVADYAAIGLLHELWWWALDYAQDGDLSHFTDRQIARACRYDGSPKVLIDALTESGFVDEQRRIHDWHDYAGKFMERRERNRERMREARQQGSSDTCDARAKHGARTCSATEPNPTEPNPTEENQEPSLPEESGPPPKVKAPKVDKLAQRAEELLAASAFPSDLLQLAEIMAAENKTGRAALSRVIRQIYEPLVELEGTVSADAMRYGLRAAITAQAPNANYVKRAAASFSRNGGGNAQRSGRAVDSAFGAIGALYRELEDE